MSIPSTLICIASNVAKDLSNINFKYGVVSAYKSQYHKQMKKGRKYCQISWKLNMNPLDTYKGGHSKLS